MDGWAAAHGRHRVGRYLPHQDDLEDWLNGPVDHIRAAVRSRGRRFAISSSAARRSA